MDAVEQLKKYTIEDIYALPDGERAELIDGHIYYMAPPSYTHQKILNYLNNQVYNYIKSNHGECEVIPAPFAVFLNEYDNNTYLEPDISVICDTSKLDEKGCHGAPDWIIEIVSPSSRPRDYIKKMLKYGTAGVREYWIVDPDEEVVIVYEFENETMIQYSFHAEIPVNIFNDFFIKIQK